MVPLGQRWCDGVDAVIAEFNLPWHCNRLGCRGEYLFQKTGLSLELSMRLFDTAPRRAPVARPTTPATLHWSSTSICAC